MHRLAFVSFSVLPVLLPGVNAPALAAEPSSAAPAGDSAEGAAAPAEISTPDPSPPDASDLPDASGSGGGKAVTRRGKDIVVVANARIPGQVDAPQAPVATFDEEDIAAYGVSTIGDLLDALSPETNSGRGRSSSGPVILVNGRRISSFRELRDYPPEAIRRVEVLPEEVALRFGYPPDQRVVNIILKDHYSSRSVEVEYSQPGAGGTSTVAGKARAVKIDKNRRFNFAGKVDHTTPMTEAVRGVAQADGSEPTVAGAPRPEDNRTLVSSTSDYGLNGTYTIPIGTGPMGGSLAINGTVSRTDVTSLNGLNTLTTTDALTGDAIIRTLPGALRAFTRTDTVQGGVGYNSHLGNWQLSATLDAGHVEATTRTSNRVSTSDLTDYFNGTTSTVPTAGDTVARSYTDTVTSLLTMIGRPLHLPAGDVSVTGKAGFVYSATTSASSATYAALGATRLRRGDVSAGFNLALPITSRKEHVGEALGDITLNFSAGADRLSDYGWLTNWSGGATWAVTSKLSFQASYIANQAAPSLANLGNPLVSTANVPVYDFATGQSVLATVTTGGNAGLARESRHDIKLGLNWTLPLFKGNSNLVVEYFNNHSSNVTSAFPLLTEAVEQAYAGRVTRDASGTIIALDERPVTIADQRQTRLRWGINIFGDLGKVIRRRGRFGVPGGPPGGGPPPGEGGADGRRDGGPGGPGGDASGARDGAGGPPGGGRRKTPPHEGRWNLSLYHTVQFIDRAQLVPGGPVLNLLGGDALSSTGGVARHSLELDSGGFYKGFGLRLNGTWSAPTRVNGTGAAGSSSLRFGALLKVNARLFVDLGQQKWLVAAAPFFKDARLSIMANNLFDQRQKVTNAAGQTPLSYQPAYMDPNGRVIGFELRKMF